MASETTNRSSKAIVTRWKFFKENLFNPEELFSNRLGTAGIKYEFILILVIGIIGAAGLAFSIDTLLEPFTTTQGVPGEMEAEPISEDVTMQLWGKVAYPLATPFVLWGYYTIGFLVMSWFFSGRGDRFKTFKYTAWGFLPFAIGTLIHSITLVGAALSIDVETELSGTTNDQVSYLLDQVMTNPIAIVGEVILILVLIWSAYLWIFSVIETRDIPRSDAIKVVALPVAMHVGYLLWGLLSTTLLA